jgi:hypothetical protein
MTGQSVAAADLRRRGVFNHRDAEGLRRELAMAANMARHPDETQANVKLLSHLEWSEVLEAGLAAEGKALLALVLISPRHGQHQGLGERSERSKGQAPAFRHDPLLLWVLIFEPSLKRSSFVEADQFWNMLASMRSNPERQIARS